MNIFTLLWICMFGMCVYVNVYTYDDVYVDVCVTVAGYVDEYVCIY